MRGQEVQMMKRLFENYRPVSNLKYISKLIECVILEQLSEHLLANNIYEPMQPAYRYGHSTETALLKVQNDILKNMDNQRVTIMLLLDLSAAFDTVSHRILLDRLRERTGVHGNALKRFESYLEDREQAACMSNVGETSTQIRYTPRISSWSCIILSLYPTWQIS